VDKPASFAGNAPPRRSTESLGSDNMAVTLYDILRPTAIATGAGCAWATPFDHGGLWLHFLMVAVGILAALAWCWPMWSLAKYTQGATLRLSSSVREFAFLSLYLLTFVSLAVVVALPAVALHLTSGA